MTHQPTAEHAVARFRQLLAAPGDIVPIIELLTPDMCMHRARDPFAAYQRLVLLFQLAKCHLHQTELLQISVLVGIGEGPTVPAFFWSLPDHYDLAAVNCARVHATTHGHPTTPRDVLADTMMLRASFVEGSASTAWVGHLPLEYGLTHELGFMAEYWIANPRRGTSWVRCFDEMPATATFQYDAWGMYICYELDGDDDAVEPKWDNRAATTHPASRLFSGVEEHATGEQRQQSSASQSNELALILATPELLISAATLSSSSPTCSPALLPTHMSWLPRAPAWWDQELVSARLDEEDIDVDELELPPAKRRRHMCDA